MSSSSIFSNLYRYSSIQLISTGMLRLDLFTWSVVLFWFGLGFETGSYYDALAAPELVI